MPHDPARHFSGFGHSQRLTDQLWEMYKTNMNYITFNGVGQDGIKAV